MRTRSETIETLNKLGIHCGDDLDLRGADLIRADLREANLYGAKLNGAKLNGANLTEANLFNAYLNRADLSGADLSRANLRGANLCEANLNNTIFRSADLSRASLRWAVTKYANLRHAKLSGIRLNWNSHELISEILYQEAETDEQEMLAAWVGRKIEWCWEQWAALNHPEVDWALEVLCGWVSEDDELPIELEEYYENTSKDGFSDTKREPKKVCPVCEGAGMVDW